MISIRQRQNQNRVTQLNSIINSRQENENVNFENDNNHSSVEEEKVGNSLASDSLEPRNDDI